MNIIRKPDYIFVELPDSPYHAEAYPYEGDYGPIYFRHGPDCFSTYLSLAIKFSDETWHEFFARLPVCWERLPYIKTLSDAFRTNEGGEA